MKNDNRITWRRAWAFAVALAATGLALSANAQNAVEAITGSIQGGTEVVRIDFTQPLGAVPAGFSIHAGPTFSHSAQQSTAIKPILLDRPGDAVGGVEKRWGTAAAVTPARTWPDAPRWKTSSEARRGISANSGLAAWPSR